MVDHSNVWMLKVTISERLAKESTDPKSMTEQHLAAFVAMSREDLDRTFQPKTPVAETVEVGEETITEVESQPHRIPAWGLRSDL